MNKNSVRRRKRYVLWRGKKILIVGILLLCSAANGLPVDSRQTEINAILGVNYSIYDKSDAPSHNDYGKFGIVIGISKEILILNFAGIEPQIKYLQKGYKIEVQDPVAGSAKHINSLHYLSCLMQLKVELREIKWLPEISIGPRVDFLLGYNGYNINDEFDDLSRVVLGMSGGIILPLYYSDQFNLSIQSFFEMDLTNSEVQYFRGVAPNSLKSIKYNAKNITWEIASIKIGFKKAN